VDVKSERLSPAGSGQRASQDAQHEIRLTQRRQMVHPRRHGQLTSWDAGRRLPVGLDQRGKSASPTSSDVGTEISASRSKIGGSGC
jgi:hypothetical protein